MQQRHIQIDNADRVPQGSAGQHDIAPWAQHRPRWLDWRTAGVLCSFALLLLLIGYWLFGRDLRAWLTYGDGANVVRGMIGLAFVYAVVVVARRALLIEQRGYKVFIWNANAPKVVSELIKVDVAYAQREMANALQVTYSPSTQAPAMLPESFDDETVEAEIVTDAIGLIPDSEWLPWLIEMPHTMIAGGTGTGKTTLARIELFERLQQGYAGIVLDPKGKDWYGLPVIGGGRKFDAILLTLDQIHTEMAQRFEAYAQGERQFDPIKVLVDEVPDIMDACLDMRRRLVDGRWSRFSRQLGSLAREIGISVTLMTQSPLVEDIGMNSAMRKNFTRIALGDEAPILIRAERDGKRRAQLQDLLRDQQYPAAIVRRGVVSLLDTSNVRTLAQRSMLRPLGWQNGAQHVTRPVVSASVKAPDVVSASVPGAVVYPAQVTSKNGRIAWLLKQKYSYRFIETELGVSHQTISQVKKAMEARP